MKWVRYGMNKADYVGTSNIELSTFNVEWIGKYQFLLDLKNYFIKLKKLEDKLW